MTQSQVASSNSSNGQIQPGEESSPVIGLDSPGQADCSACQEDWGVSKYATKTLSEKYKNTRLNASM